jgi:hypothetical protein
MDYDNTNSGALFRNDNKNQPNHPDHKGSVDVKCPHCEELSPFWLSAWIKTAGERAKTPGSKFFSLALTPKEPSDDDIPF